jgi:dipeptidyl aminopeptidase/acylaminoacyl peptidase
VQRLPLKLIPGAEDVAYDLRRYLSVKSAYSPAFSPDDKRIAYLSDLTGLPQVWMVGSSGDASPQQITIEDERVAFLSYAPRSDRIAFGMDKGGSERFQIYMIEGEGASMVRLTNEPEVIHAWGDWSPDETAVAFSSNARNHQYFDIYVQQLGDRSTELMYRCDGNAYPVTWSPDGSRILFQVANAPFDQDLFILQLDDKKADLLTPHKGEAAFHSATFDESGEFVYCVTDRDREFSAIAKIEVNTHDMEYLHADDWDVEAFAPSRDKRSFAFTLNEGGVSKLALWDVPTGARREVGLPSGIVGGLEWSHDGRRLAFSLSTSTSNSDVWVCDLLGGGSQRLSRLTFSSMCGIPPTSLVEPELIKARSFDEVEVPSFLYLPKGSPPFPLIVLLHGGPESQFRPGFSSLIQFFVKLGFAVLATNFRGSTGYGRRYTHLDDVRGRMDTVRDVELALRHVLDRYPVDRDRIVAWGGSYGGFMVLACLYSSPEMWAAGVDIVGISNFITFLKNTGPWRRKLRIAEYGDPEKDREFLERISPINNAHKITSPLFIIHGTNDPRVPISEARQIEEILKRSGRTVQLMEFDDEGHGLVKLKNRIAGYTAAVEFVMRQLS